MIKSCVGLEGAYKGTIVSYRELSVKCFIVCPGTKRLLFFDFHPIRGGTYQKWGLIGEIEKVVLQYGWGRGSGRYIVRQFY